MSTTEGYFLHRSFIIITQRPFNWLMMATTASKNLGRVCSVFQIPKGLLHLFVQFVVIMFDFGLSILHWILREKKFINHEVARILYNVNYLCVL